MNELKISSKKIADILKRKHKDIVNTIKFLIKFLGDANFSESTYISRGK